MENCLEKFWRRERCAQQRAKAYRRLDLNQHAAAPAAGLPSQSKPDGFASSPKVGALGKPGQPCCLLRPDLPQGRGPRCLGLASAGLCRGARLFPERLGFVRPAQTPPTCQGLPLWGRWHREAMTERASPAEWMQNVGLDNAYDGRDFQNAKNTPGTAFPVPGVLVY